MEPLIIKIKEDTPAVVFFPKYKKFQIIGTSWPEMPSLFYGKIIDWLKEYFNNPLKETTFEFFFKYINTQSFKEIIKLFQLLKEEASRHKIKIIWYYEPEDIDMQRFGKRLEYFIGLPMEYREKIIKSF